MNPFMDFGPPYWTESTPPPAPDSEVSKYRIKNEINSTNSSIYYLCLDLETNEARAIKFIKVIESKIERIKDELQTLNMAQQNPNIIKFFDSFRHDAFICVVVPYTHQLSIGQYIRNEYPKGIPEEIAANMMLQMLNAIQFLHSNNILHRDIKPESFLVFNSDDSKYPNVILSNFEYAKVCMDGEKDFEYLGTPEFVAPEIINHLPYDNRIDIWSLGTTLFVMLSGQLPFPKNPDEMMKNASKGLLDYQALFNRGISQPAIDFIKKMCQVEPDKRITPEEGLKDDWILNPKHEDEKVTISETTDDYSNQYA